MSNEQEATLVSREPKMTSQTVAWWFDQECLGASSGALDTLVLITAAKSQKRTTPSFPAVTNEVPSNEATITTIGWQCLLSIATKSPVDT